MPITRRLLREEVTYSDAKEKEVNILHQLGYYDKKQEYFTHIDSKRSWIKGVVAHHLGLRSPDACHVADLEDWFHGSSNVCVPITIANWKGKQRQQPGQRVLLRLPLPYRVGEAFNPGNGDEKVRCEAGTYAWLQGNCPDVPIPRMYGFGMSTGETVCGLKTLIANAWAYEDDLVYSSRKPTVSYSLLSMHTPPAIVMVWPPSPFTIYPSSAWKPGI